MFTPYPRKMGKIEQYKRKATATYVLVSLLSIAYTLVIFFGEFFLPSDDTEWCRAAQYGYTRKTVLGPYENPDCINNPCFYERVPRLLFLNLDEIDFARRMLIAVLLGGCIGLERTKSGRLAGIRTMSLVSLGACSFSVASQRSFRSSTMGWDAARVAAAIPSGVGFLGAALIWKGSSSLSAGDKPEVHGLTTAASVWLTAAIGIGAGGKLIVVSVYCTALVVITLRVGKTFYLTDDQSYVNDLMQDEDWDSDEVEEEEGDELEGEDEDVHETVYDNASSLSAFDELTSGVTFDARRRIV